MLAAIGLRQYPTKAEFRTMHPMRTRIGQLSASQYYRPSHVDLGLPLTILTRGFASGTEPNPIRHPGAGSPGCEWAPYASWPHQSYLGKKGSSTLGQAQNRTKSSMGQITPHTQQTTPFPSRCSLLMRIQHDWGRMIKARPSPRAWLGQVG